MGKTMIIAAWVIALGLLTVLFNSWLERERNPNRRIAAYTMTDGGREIRLQRNRYGHYVASGHINNRSVEFLLDTGASDVSVPAGVARRLGLRRGAPVNYETANGNITAYATRLPVVRLGNIVLTDVRASINPHLAGDEILLGMSFLKQIEFTQRGDSLILRQY
jgi:aspartyl protease family protein